MWSLVIPCDPLWSSTNMNTYTHTLHPKTHTKHLQGSPTTLSIPNMTTDWIRKILVLHLLAVQLLVNLLADKGLYKIYNQTHYLSSWSMWNNLHIFWNIFAKSENSYFPVAITKLFKQLVFDAVFFQNRYLCQWIFLSLENGLLNLILLRKNLGKGCIVRDTTTRKLAY